MMNSNKKIQKAYRQWAMQVGKRWVWPSFFSKNHQNALLGLTENLVKFHGEQQATQTQNGGRVWFHAASVGELESIWPVVVAFSQREKSELILTVFSESAYGALQKLCGTLNREKSRLLFQGYSPWEGQWKEAIEAFKPNVFVTAKYEAWPDLWMALSNGRVPLFVISAKLRSALKWASRICHLLGAKLPQLHFLTANDEDGLELKRYFPEAEIQNAGEPRWDRVFERASQGNPRARVLVEAVNGLNRPWGILGSIWMEDLELWKGRFPVDGTIWLVPHRVDAEYIQKIVTFLENSRFTFLKTSQISANFSGEATLREAQTQFVLVDEMGFLLELYSAGDWAFIGGGYGKGLHSTIEPAIHGLPIAGGPARATRFAEVAELIKGGQLTIISRAAGLERWVKTDRLASAEQRQAWKAAAEGRRGATQRVLSALERSLH